VPAGVATLALPDTRLVREARALIEAAAPPAIVNHSVRAYLLGKAYAARRAVEVDPEDLCLAALFHDLGLCAGQGDPGAPFTFASSRRLRAFLAERGVAPARAGPLADAIDYHMQLFPRWSKGPAAGLLQVGAWMDVTLRKRWSIRAEARAIARAFPRAGIDWRFPWALARSLRSPRACVGLLAPGWARR
jgi:hypothetical protein